MHRPSELGGVADETLDALSMWPEGSRGDHEEVLLVRTLNALCKKYGYGRVPQLAAWIEDIWRHPEKVEQYRQIQAQAREDIRRVLRPEGGVDAR